MQLGPIQRSKRRVAFNFNTNLTKYFSHTIYGHITGLGSQVQPLNFRKTQMRMCSKALKNKALLIGTEGPLWPNSVPNCSEPLNAALLYPLFIVGPRFAEKILIKSCALFVLPTKY